jgi:hypothetical protein
MCTNRVSVSNGGMQCGVRSAPCMLLVQARAAQQLLLPYCMLTIDTRVTVLRPPVLPCHGNAWYGIHSLIVCHVFGGPNNPQPVALPGC